MCIMYAYIWLNSTPEGYYHNNNKKRASNASLQTYFRAVINTSTIPHECQAFANRPNGQSINILIIHNLQRCRNCCVVIVGHHHPSIPACMRFKDVGMNEIYLSFTGGHLWKYKRLFPPPNAAVSFFIFRTR